ncbi:PAN domain-containing protein At5g03700 [Ananas comosus]|uniref:non-specific serine/threonine protein kinase n=1 Tax=Ananas comosus TaxID=4615 RepID=A0A6P5H351_ANACO|nr:PAN domain-containing protein At5g03700 [Ananas comosus]XP_020112278.1 PAN domain-containing protein At5g03700 [Ananas comosus]XP_020112279.1 PAN domain-containing protein At5g03700 [Ananas comosus]XP_020112280.1 PAN domain-containing protein At5g03700 [Ananas comosus]XP_020112281.1 PAN domain-containing protein At5g03700 [Ananas comosus]
MTSTKEAILGGVFMLSAAVVIGVGSGDSTVAQEMERGFAATHSPTDAPFQPILSDASGTFYLGFLRVGSSLLDLAVIHLPSSFPVWRATPARPALWSSPVSLSFNGSLLLAHPQSGRLLWSSSSSAVGGDRVVILASSDLQIRKDGGGGDVAWQSFRFPADTVVQSQNFTSGMSLFSPGRRFTMHLGTNYFGLYFVGGATTMYWRHTALEAKAQVQPGGAPLYMRVDPDGFLGMYQNGSDPVDVIAFNTFSRNMTGQFRRLTLEDDANLHAYYWSGTGWVGEYTAIADACEIPTTCGAYSVCRPGAGAGAHQCTCLANGTDGCLATPTGDFCGSGGGGTEFTVLRRSRVDLGNKEVMSPRAAASVDECEGSCARNCSCWGAIYSNATNTCYQVDYPVQLLLQGDQWHVGYFKVRSNGRGGGSNGDEGSKEEEEEEEARRTRAKVALLVVGTLILVAAAGFGAYKVWGRRRAIAVDREGLAPGPYKDLGKASFKSIEIELASSSSSSSPPHS